MNNATFSNNQKTTSFLHGLVRLTSKEAFSYGDIDVLEDGFNQRSTGTKQENRLNLFTGTWAEISFKLPSTNHKKHDI